MYMVITVIKHISKCIADAHASFEYRRLSVDVIEVYNIINQHDRVDIKFFTILDNTSTRGNSLKFCIDKRRSRLTIRAYYFPTVL